MRVRNPATLGTHLDCELLFPVMGIVPSSATRRRIFRRNLRSRTAASTGRGLSLGRDRRMRLIAGPGQQLQDRPQLPRLDRRGLFV
jgi:hypothetical protein